MGDHQRRGGRVLRTHGCNQRTQYCTAKERSEEPKSHAEKSTRDGRPRAIVADTHRGRRSDGITGNAISPRRTSAFGPRPKPIASLYFRKMTNGIASRSQFLLSAKRPV